MAHKLKSKDFKKIGISDNKIISLSISIINKHFKRQTHEESLKIISKVKEAPESFLSDEILGPIAVELYTPPHIDPVISPLKETPVPISIFGDALIKENAIKQMRAAATLPVAEAAALMPDSHLGYGLPIGGVLATKNSAIPYAVGMDIGCRMSLSLYDVTERYFHKHVHKFTQSIKNNTAFGLAKTIEYKQEHAFLDRDIFHETPLLKKLKSKAARQLGSSGSGNHFVEWGIVELEDGELLNLPAGKYIGLLAHSGSRGFGASIARFYSDLAAKQSTLPHNMRHLSWLDLDTESGQEYWQAMNYAGDFAKACHDRIHINVAKPLGLKPLARIENHHNFAWKEQINGEEFIVHRKGATPASKDEMGIIPASMTDPGYIVRGKGNAASLNSASHGAGRRYSRKETVSKNTKSEMSKYLREKGVTLIGGALDESPFAYKNLDQVMEFQSDLVDKMGKFYPRIVRMDRDK